MRKLIYAKIQREKLQLPETFFSMEISSVPIYIYIYIYMVCVWRRLFSLVLRNMWFSVEAIVIDKHINFIFRIIIYVSSEKVIYYDYKVFEVRRIKHYV